MRLSLKDLMDNLGVGYILSAYETCPWSVYQDEDEEGENGDETTSGQSCNAEVRMNNDADELEAEIQLMRDNPVGDEKPIEQIFWLLAKPATGDKWDVKLARVKNENKTETVHGWEDKAVSFFHACVQELKLDKIPDIEEIYEREMNKKDRFSDNSQGGTSKAPKVNQNPAIRPKGGMGR